MKETQIGLKEPDVMMICIDGLSWNPLKKFIGEGILPNFTKIIRSGISGEMKTIPRLSPTIWATIYTGKSPEKHGVVDFFINTKTIKSKQIWEILDENGYDVGVFNPLTALNFDQSYCFFIPGDLYPIVDAYPLELKFLKEIVSMFRSGNISVLRLFKYSYELLIHGCSILTLLRTFLLYMSIRSIDRSNEHSLIYKISMLKRISSIINSKIFIYCLKKYKPTFSVYYDNGLDFVSHYYWNYLENERYSSNNNKNIKIYKNVIKNYYILIDRILGYITSKNDNCIYFIISDHGFIQHIKGKDKNI